MASNCALALCTLCILHGSFCTPSEFLWKDLMELSKDVESVHILCE